MINVYSVTLFSVRNNINDSKHISTGATNVIKGAVNVIHRVLTDYATVATAIASECQLPYSVEHPLVLCAIL